MFIIKSRNDMCYDTYMDGTVKNKKAISCMDAALNYLAVRNRSVFEMRSYLNRKEYPDEEIDKVVSYLLDISYLNDFEFAKDFTRSKLQLKHYSKKQISYQLNKYRIDKEITEAVLSDVDEEVDFQNALRIAEKKTAHCGSGNNEGYRAKIGQYLFNKGFSYAVIRRVLDCILNEEEEGR